MAEDLRHPLEDFWGSPFDYSEDDPPCKPGRKAKHDVGVGYYAPWEEPYDGFALHSRRNAMALASSGVAVQLRSLDPGGQLQAGAERSRIAKQMEPLLLNEIAQYAAQVYQLVPSAERIEPLLQHARRDPKVQRIINRYTVLYGVWERMQVGRHTTGLLNGAGQVWVACDANKGMLERCGLDAGKCKVVPCPYFDDDPLLGIEGQQRKPGPPRFYHIGKWEPRKEQHLILGAFLRAFRPGEARLWLKTSAYSPPLGEYPRDAIESVHRWMDDEPVKENGWTIEVVNRNVYMIRKALPESQLRDLHRIGDVYVTLSRGEGFDMPAFDSKLAGNAMLYTPSGGPQDFCGEDDEQVKATGLVECHPFYAWEDEARYLDYSFEDAVTAMRRAAERVRAGDGIKRRNVDLDRFRAQNVGRQMREHLEELLDGPLVKEDG